MSERIQSVTLQYGLLALLVTGITTVTVWIVTQLADLRATIREHNYRLHEEIVVLEKKLDLHIATTQKEKP